MKNDRIYELKSVSDQYYNNCIVCVYLNFELYDLMEKLVGLKNWDNSLLMYVPTATWRSCREIVNLRNYENENFQDKNWL